MVRACFGCGSTAHLIQDCPHRTTQKVQEVREEMEEPEILFIGHTEIVEDHEFLARGFSQEEDLQGIAVLNASWFGQGDDQLFQGSSRG